jgi:hypothetical protein
MIQVVAPVYMEYIGVCSGVTCNESSLGLLLVSVVMSHSSIGNMTNTLIDTGSRHMQQCRTNYDVLAACAGSENELINNDDKWCMAKDELVVSCNKHIIPGAAITATKYAYPSVVTTMGALGDNANVTLAGHYHFMGTGLDMRDAMKDSLTKSETQEAINITQQLRNFIPVGYSVGRACAHGYKGDTIASVQIGGLRTVMNGAFEVQTGDLIQMYIPQSEQNLFNNSAGRKHFKDVAAVMVAVTTKGIARKQSKEDQRRNYYSRGLGMVPNGGSDRVKTGMFSIKPYTESHNENQIVYYGDKIRIFARAVSSARPYEPVDIMIARQSL